MRWFMRDCASLVLSSLVLGAACSLEARLPTRTPFADDSHSNNNGMLPYLQLQRETSPRPTAPLKGPAIATLGHGLLRRDVNDTVCGYVDGNSSDPIECSEGYCALDDALLAMGCCTGFSVDAAADNAMTPDGCCFQTACVDISAYQGYYCSGSTATECLVGDAMLGLVLLMGCLGLGLGLGLGRSLGRVLSTSRVGR
ncbi:uncharacterized protein A1O5_02070 [Cladophialophora psammophila CBS 110553]|uniref:Hydrophobin n=1 Tax=Cladophialophora psammophila CBS 110553 TaxID=1182543 RepID=W9XYN7_9EURO|nr:uncharacterized protein A1O5_02070 [Cladophialophora psammophila CBS 110553]EXJ75374.1 hypothetical protein A1O5_02070 [Cladophialophora psammophila CBS 110553]